MYKTEFLKREEDDFLYAPYLKVQFEVTMPKQKTFFQIFEIMQGGIIPLVYCGNIPLLEGKERDIAAYLLENEGNLECFLFEEEEMKQLQVGSVLQFETCRMRVCSIQKNGYMQKKQQRRVGDIELM